MKLVKSSFILILSIIISFSCIHGKDYETRRDRLTQPDKVMDIIGVKKGMEIGIVGAGKGYFTFKMCKKVGNNGKIYANEIDQDKIDYIKEKYKREKITNIKTVLGKVDEPLFPDGKMDMVFMCYVFHDLKKPVELIKSIRSTLKPGANLVILDQDQTKTGDTHFMTKKTIINKLKEAKYKIIKIETFLERDNIYICRPE